MGRRVAQKLERLTTESSLQSMNRTFILQTPYTIETGLNSLDYAPNCRKSLVLIALLAYT